MTLRYVTQNFITADTPIFASSEHEIYTTEHLHDVRPSYPFRFTGKGSVADPEWVCVDLITARRVDFTAIFNHNFFNPTINLKACDQSCFVSGSGSGMCPWGAQPVLHELSTRIPDGYVQFGGHRNLYQYLWERYRYFRLEVIDPDNAWIPHIGEWFLGRKKRFSSSVHLQPGREDGPKFYDGDVQTDYGQHWPTYYSTQETLKLTFRNIGDPQVQDEMHTWLRTIKEDFNGRFIIIPDDNLKFCYYVILKTKDGFATREIYGDEGEVRSWSFILETLTEGRITL